MSKISKDGLQIALRIAMEALGYMHVTDPNHEQVAEVNNLAKKIIAGDADISLVTAYKEELEKGDKSNYIDRYDYVSHYERVISPAVADILKVFGEYAEELKPIYTRHENAEDAKAQDLKIKEIDEKVYLSIFKVLNDREVPVTFYGELFGFLSSLVTNFKGKVDDTIITEKDLLMSIAVGTKHPEYNNYNVDFATEKQINDASKKLLDEKGIDRKEYFGE